MNLTTQLQAISETMGSGYFGIADLAIAHGAILEQGGEWLGAFPRAVSIGIRLLNAIVDQLPQRAERAVAMNYVHHAYALVNQRLDHVASMAAGQIQEAGYRALPIPASQTIDEKRYQGAFSHKLAAHLAGLGWIGKSCLLITPQVGPRVRWATVLTDAPLEPTGKMMEDECADCLECVQICPVGAFSGRHFVAEEPREARYAAHLCADYLDTMEADEAACGMCLYICPFGKK
jgi:epoxyqueuosine reductase